MLLAGSIPLISKVLGVDGPPVVSTGLIVVTGASFFVLVGFLVVVVVVRDVGLGFFVLASSSDL